MCFHRYKETELNLENKQEKSRSNSDEFKRLFFGGEGGICQYERMRIFVVSGGLALHIAHDYWVQMVMLITIVDAIHYPSFDKEKIPKYRDFFGGEGGI